MIKPKCLRNKAVETDQDLIRSAFSAWHRGESLTSEQREIIEAARVQNMARIFGISL